MELVLLALSSYVKTLNIKLKRISLLVHGGFSEYDVERIIKLIEFDVQNVHTTLVNRYYNLKDKYETYREQNEKLLNEHERTIKKLTDENIKLLDKCEHLPITNDTKQNNGHIPKYTIRGFIDVASKKGYSRMKVLEELKKIVSKSKYGECVNKKRVVELEEILATLHEEHSTLKYNFDTIKKDNDILNAKLSAFEKQPKSKTGITNKHGGKVTCEMVRKIRKLSKDGMRGVDIHKETQVPKGTISRIINNKLYTNC